MCGIFGMFKRSPDKDFQQRLFLASSLLRHRGPNDEGCDISEVSGGVLALGQTRLSIIDLSPAGHQPLYSFDKRYAIVFNGEIYNYKELRKELQALGLIFRTDTDTEVLLSSWITWGAGCLAKLKGMFAFVIYDRVEQEITLVRDAFGIKPIFFQRQNDAMYFASELPALMALNTQKPALNVARAYSYLLESKYDDADDTFYKDIKQLSPGHFLKLKLSHDANPELTQWWWPSIKQTARLSLQDAVHRLRELFLQNIKLHLRSDVPLGAALSGGVDSSAVVCAMRYLEPDMPIHTFSYIARGSAVDEEKWADLVNAHVGAIPHKVTVSASELARDLDDMISTQGEPFGGTSIYAQYRVFKLANESGVTVTLDGQGADELLAGYNGYPGSRLTSLFESGDYLEAIRFMHAWPKWPGRSFGQIARTSLSLALPEQIRSILRNSRSPSPSMPQWLKLSEDELQAIATNVPILKSSEGRSRRLMETLRATLTGNGLASLLRHGDRNSMRWSIESRVPFLTIDMAEFLFSLPENYLISSTGETKHIFRLAMRGIVPDQILDRKDKIGFSTPEHAWLKELGPIVLQWVDEAADIKFLDANKTRMEIQAIVNGEKPFSYQAWRLINYCRWATLSNATVN